MINNFEVPNFGSIQPQSSEGNMHRIISSLNESMDTSDVEVVDYVNESADLDLSESTVNALCEYYDKLDEGYGYKSNEVLSNAGVELAVDSYGHMIINEKIVSTGAKIVKGKKVKAHKTKLTNAQLKARSKTMKKNAKKMARKAHSAAANKSRAKSMKKARQLKEGLELRRTLKNNLIESFESQGIPVDEALINQFVRNSISEAIDVEDSNPYIDRIESAVSGVLTGYGATILDSVSSVEDGMVAVTVTIDDSGAELYLGNIADELGLSTNTEVAYGDLDIVDDPEEPSTITFYFLGDDFEVNESCGGKSKKVEEGCDDPNCDDPNCDGSHIKDKNKKVEEGCDNPNCDGSHIKDDTKNESWGSPTTLVTLNESVTGDKLYDIESDTTFTLMSTPRECDKGYTAFIQVNESKDMVPGAQYKVVLSDSGYELLN